MIKNKRLTKKEKQRLREAILISQDLDAKTNNTGLIESENYYIPANLKNRIIENNRIENRKNNRHHILTALLAMVCLILLISTSGSIIHHFIDDVDSNDIHSDSIELDRMIRLYSHEQTLDSALEAPWTPNNCTKTITQNEDNLYYIEYEFDASTSEQLYGNILTQPSHIRYWQVNSESAYHIITNIGCLSKTINKHSLYYLYNDDDIIAISVDDKYGYIFETKKNGVFSEDCIEKMAISLIQ